MGNIKKCVICGDPIKKDEETIPYKNRTAHLRCFNVDMKSVGNKIQKDLTEKTEEKKRKSKTKPVTEIKDDLSEEEFGYKKKFIAYLKERFNTEELPTSLYAMTNNIIKKYGLTYEGIYQTIQYLYEIKGDEINFTDKIIGLIPFYYDEAKKYFSEVERININNNDKDVSKMYKEKIVVIRPPERVIKQLPFD